MKEKVYVGPIWGQVCLLEDIFSKTPNHEVVFFGGYFHFSEPNSNIANFFLKHREASSFNISRFENEILVLMNFQEEKNYHFKRWINPFSGILSFLKTYNTSLEAFLADPERLNETIEKKMNHEVDYLFLKSWTKNNLPDAVELQIENSIEDKTAFKKLSVYRANGETFFELKFKENILENYISDSLEKLKEYETL